MASLSSRPAASLAVRLQRHGFENRGISHLWMATTDLSALLNISETAEADDRAVVDQFIGLSPAVWHKWFFTDLDGQPILVGVSPLDQEA